MPDSAGMATVACVQPMHEAADAAHTKRYNTDVGIYFTVSERHVWQGPLTVRRDYVYV